VTDTGLVVLDLASDPAFTRRRPHLRDSAAQIKGMSLLAHAFLDAPDSILNVLVDAAIDLCGADSAGISIERRESAEKFYEWVATAGQYKRFLNAMLPLYPSACGICLERGEPQLFRVSQRFFDLMGIEAPTVTDGMLLPWQVEETRGTFWIMSHREAEAFDGEDLRMMRALAEFASMAVLHQRQQAALLQQASAAAAARMANELRREGQQWQQGPGRGIVGSHPAPLLASRQTAPATLPAGPQTQPQRRNRPPICSRPLTAEC
jgi:hypothetical protein